MKKKLYSLLTVISFVTFISCTSSPSSSSNKDLAVVKNPDVTRYSIGDTFSSEGIVVYSVQESKAVTDYSLSLDEGYIFQINDIGKKDITVSKDGYNSTKFTVEVFNDSQISLGGTYQTTFDFNSFFNQDGLIVYLNNVITTDYTSSIKPGTKLTESGKFDVVISIEGIGEAKYEITVNKEKSLFVSSLPTKSTYVQGENFEIDGLIIIDQNDELVTDYDISIQDGEVLKYATTMTITVSKTGYNSATFEIVINEKGGGTIVNKDIIFLYLNDLHGSFIRNNEQSEAGISYISKYIRDTVSVNPDKYIVLSGGDMFQGGYESNETRGAIMIDAMNIIGFDAMVLGNHEFDWGEEYIYSFAEQLNCPIISANTFYSSDQETRPSWLSPYTIIQKGDVKVGIIGAARNNMGSSITGSISNNFYFPQANSYIKYYSDDLRLNHNCDVVVAAFHDEGFDGYNGSPTQYEDLTQISAESGHKYVDAMFFAHDHLRKEGNLNGVPYIESGCNGKNIGVLELNLEGNGVVYTVKNSSTENLWADSECKAKDPDVEALTQKPEYKEIIDLADQVIYTFKNEYTYESKSFTDVACMAMYWYVNNHLDKFDYTTIYLSSHNTGGIRSGVSIGDFTRRDLIKVFPFDNQLSIQTCTRNNINSLKSSTYYATYSESDPVYDSKGYTKAVSITYITESTYAYRYQVDYKNYPFTAKEALVEYLLSGVNDKL